jgi:hypothetical protein
MAEYGTFDAATGMRSSPMTAPNAHMPGAFDGAVAAAWNPPGDLQSSDPHDQPPFQNIGAGLAPVDGPLPPNIHGGEVGAVAADFGGGYDCGEVPDNIHTD